MLSVWVNVMLYRSYTLIRARLIISFVFSRPRQKLGLCGVVLDWMVTKCLHQWRWRNYLVRCMCALVLECVCVCAYACVCVCVCMWHRIVCHCSEKGLILTNGVNPTGLCFCLERAKMRADTPKAVPRGSKKAARPIKMGFACLETIFWTLKIDS